MKPRREKISVEMGRKSRGSHSENGKTRGLKEEITLHLFEVVGTTRDSGLKNNLNNPKTREIENTVDSTDWSPKAPRMEPPGKR